VEGEPQAQRADREPQPLDQEEGEGDEVEATGGEAATTGGAVPGEREPRLIEPETGGRP